jgi:hypothetical protein
MTQPRTADDRDLIDVPLSELHLTAKGRKALIEGDSELAREALDILLAVAYWQDTRGKGDPATWQPSY